MDKISKENELKKEDIKDLLLQLKQRKEKLEEERSKFEKEKMEFELSKREEEAKFKEKLLEEELKHKKKLQEEKLKILDKIREEAQKDIEEIYKNLEKKQKELDKKLLEISQFEKEKKEFESKKNDMLKAFKEELNCKKSQILSDFQAKQAEKLNEIVKKQEEMFEKINKKIKEKEEFLNKKEGKLNQKEAWLEMKEEELELLKEEIKINEREKVRSKISYLEEKISNLEEIIELLKEEKESYKEKLQKYEEFEHIDELYKTLNDLKNKLKNMENSYEEMQKEKDDIILELKNEISNLRKEYEKTILENESLQNENMTILMLRNENESLKLEKESLEHNIKILEGELKIERKKLESIYSQGKELELRVQEIVNNPYFDEISEETLDITDEIEYLLHIQKSMKNYGVEYPKRLIYAFHTALKCAEFSPLTVLYGVSGTGKSELPKLYSYFGGFNFIAEAVQPTWDSPESMIGYFNTLENKFDATNITKFLFQVFLSEEKNPNSLHSQMNMILLDEINLAHIELYFAEFLSKFEQRRGSKEVYLDIKLGTNQIYNLPLRKNLLWIGTMNDDETTKSLSDKVLDRSYLINFPRPKELFSRRSLKKLDRKEFKYLPKSIWESWIITQSLEEEIILKFKEITNNINQVLMPTGRAIGHRVWQSMEFYMQNHPLVNEYKGTSDIYEVLKIAYEEQLVQKIMPKLKGIETYGKEKEILNTIQNILIKNNIDIIEDFKSAMNNPYGQFIWNSANYIFKEI